ncbi:unnamed protein product [Kuraishia capsulata CBS 1993]|uniref:Actin-binding protein n=1 Tax=Kuraishia capsulata CBS 1993 TaxID=1382522 RepID=W6MF76_9ASCO|nr:uncharacterized protein KUCA_T00000046001 [Kuraishia capsulata CBS 1993]CDK24086.1 unnamed protein product [Kuraishia capsulata CBS 1993]
MEKLDLSTNAKEISSLYDKIGSGDPSTTYVIFTSEKAVLVPTANGDGDITDFVEEFEEGRVQFGLCRIKPPGSDVSKLILLGWCPDSAPLRSRTSFAHNFADVARILKGYHVQITARDSDDLDVAAIVKTVSDSAGARYSIQSVSTATPSFKPTPKPKTVAPTPKEIKPIVPKPAVKKPAPAAPADEDGWNGEEEIEERDFFKKPLETLPSAYKPTKVDIDALRKGVTPKSPVLAAKNDAPVKPATSSADEISSKVHIYDSYADDGRLTSLPKPKVNHSVASRYQPAVQPAFATKTPDFSALPKKNDVQAASGASRDFAGENGKTPAQIWAEKHGKYKVVESEDGPVKSASPEPVPEPSIADVRSKFASASIADEDESPKASYKTIGVPVFPPAAKAAEPEPEPESEPEVEEEEEEEEEEEQEKEATPPPAHITLPPREPVKAEPKSTLRAVAEYEYEKDEDNEISFSEGETITEIEKVDEDWWKGTNAKGESGLFPATYVKIEEEKPAVQERSLPPAPPAREPVVEEKPATPSAVAEYDYDATEDNELTFKEGDLITEVEFVDDDWWLGTLNGERKLFPSNYVTLQD